MILIIDFGSQTTHLIARRVRELGVEVKIGQPPKTLQLIDQLKPKGIILSGGPASVYTPGAPTINKQVFTQPIPILGICYGLQLTAHLLDGQVKPGKKKEFGPAIFTITSKPPPLFAGLPASFPVWMSHGDEVVKPPKGAVVVGSTETIPIASFADVEKKLYGIMFHPEVIHTPLGREVLKNFVEKICQIPTKRGKLPSIDQLVAQIKEQIGDGRAVCALSGGIDSSTAAVLAHQAIGNRLTAIYVDTGLMRKDETEEIAEIFKQHFHMNLKIIHAEDEFLNNLSHITNPEKKRKIIGRTFIRVFEREAKKIGADYLVQGTIYPDVIESAGTLLSAKIKTHHNVGGLPRQHGFLIVEPLRYLYKDEVRKLAKKLNLPKEITSRHMFPGPGLAVRIIGEVTKEKLDILRQADAIVVEELKIAGWYNRLWMGFAILAGVKTTGVTGDERRYGETIAIRAITSKDAMTADFARLPYSLLARISSRVVNEIPEVARVVYDITTKPPATMEWE